MRNEDTSRTYTSGLTYLAGGQMSKEQFGTTTAIYNKLFYNSRGQLSEIREGTTYTGPSDTGWERSAIINFYDTCWGMCSGQSMPINNGNLKRQQIYIPGEAMRDQAFDYDSLNRLHGVHEHKDGDDPANDLQQQYSYDRYGNRTLNQANTFGNGIPNPYFGVDPSTNRLTPAGGYTMHYDAAGNLDNDNYTGQGQRSFDGENRMTAAWSNGQWQSYVYDADGHRVKRIVNGVETWEVYGIGGELVADYAQNGAPASPQKEYGYRNGQLLITAESGVALGIAPTGLAETTATSSSISVSWSATNGATNYRIERKQANAVFTYAGNTSSTSWSNSVSAGSAYLYRVCAADGSNNCTSSFSNIALGVAVSFTDDPIVGVSETSNPANATTIKATHINELRAAVQAVRDLAIVGSASYTHANPTAGVSLVYVEDVRELRSELNEALAVLHLETPPFTDPTLVGVHEDAAHATPVRAVHIRELRQRLKGTIGSSCYKSVEQFVKDSYQGVLKRQPNSSELASATASLESAQSSGASALITAAQNLGSSLFNSTEYVNLGTSNDQFVTDLYNGYLQRAEDTSGHNYWLGVLQGSSRAYLIANFGGSIEFTENAKALCRTAGGGSTVGSVHWLIADQLGTPRMILDASGSLANVSRHDYLPFGEELTTQGGRTPQLGYTSDSTRQKFTQKKRDSETGLDYFGARYYASSQGRFTSPDPLSAPACAHPNVPQSWNLYAYVLNNPLKLVDPDSNWRTKRR